MSAAGQPQPLELVGQTPRYPQPVWEQEGLRLTVTTADGSPACVVAYQSPDRIASVSVAAPSTTEGETARRVWETLTMLAAAGVPASEALARIQETEACVIDRSRDLTRIVHDLGVSS